MINKINNMKKIKLFAGIFSLGFASANAQCALPTGYNFENFISAASFTPCTAGWSTNISGTFTYAGGQVGLAGKLDLQGEYIKFFSSDVIGVVTYYVKGNYGTPATSWSGTFDLDESVNGTSWTNITHHTVLNGSTYQSFTK